jgi:hypothetical protein
MSELDDDVDAPEIRRVGRRAFARTVGVGGVALLATGVRGAARADAATGSWNLSGNAGTTPPSSFLGTTDGQPLVLKTNNVERVRVVAGGQVGIGTTSPTAGLHVKASTAGATAILGKSTGATNASARGVAGSVTDQGYGVRGDAGSGFGVYGNALAGVGVGGTSNNIGVRGNGTSVGVDAITGPNGTGVRSSVDGGAATAVRAGATSGGTGVSATSDTGLAVLAFGGSVGVYALADAGGTGVSSSTSGDNSASKGVSGTVPNLGYGVYGSAGSGFGVYGTSSAASGVAVGGDGAADGIGVKGHVPSTGYGLYGVADGAGIGVYGTCGANGNAGRFDGAVVVNGGTQLVGPAGQVVLLIDEPGLSTALRGGEFAGHDIFANNLYIAGTKNFRIDHPQDPANKFLVHSCVESDERMNVYSGSAVLDAQGRATVRLPSYFHALNRDARVQLTAVGRGHVWVEHEVADGRFVIGGDADRKVFWQVSGVRQDAYAKANPMTVEVDKAPHERGLYATPEAHGFGSEHRINRAVRHAGPAGAHDNVA